MTGYVRKDTTNNIADGNVINAADLDAEFDGVQDAFNASTGHKHDGTAGEGATINALGPTQDVTVSASLVAPKTTNTVDIGSNSLKFKDLFLAGNGSVGGTLAVTGVATLTAQPILSSLTASRAVFTDGSKGLVSNAITGTGNVVMSASPTLTGTIGGENATLSGTLGVTGVATFTAQPILSSLTASRAVFSDGSKGLVSNAITGTGNVVMSASPTLTGTIDAAALTASGNVTLSGGTANGVAYLNGSKVVTSGSALTFDGSKFKSTNAGAAEIAVFESTGITAGYTIVKNSTVSAITVADSGLGLVKIGSSTNHPYVFLVNDSEQMRLNSTGLGIGTSTAYSKLYLKQPGNGSGVAGFVIENSANDNRLAQYFDGSGDEWRITASYGSTGAFKPITFWTSDTKRLTLDSSGNLGLGVTPSAWDTSRKAFQISTTGALVSSSLNTLLGDNWYVDASSNKYLTTGAVALYQLTGGQHRWYNAPSGTAGNAITFTQAMTLDADGRLGVGVTSPIYKFQVDGTIAARFANPDVTAMLVQATTGTNAAAMTFNNTGGNGYVGLDSSNGSRVGGGAYSLNIWHEGNYPVVIGTNNTKRLTVDSSGNLLVGTTSGNARLRVLSTASQSQSAYITHPTFDQDVISCENSATSGDNKFISFYTDATVNRGNISYNRGAGLVAYNVTSDYRAKDINGPVVNSGALIDSVPVYMGKMKGATQERPMFIAHETPSYAHTGEKDAVDENGNPVYQQMDASALIPVMWAEIQSLRKRLADAGI